MLHQNTTESIKENIASSETLHNQIFMYCIKKKIFVIVAS